jgi:Tol biopolymer transport system component
VTVRLASDSSVRTLLVASDGSAERTFATRDQDCLAIQSDGSTVAYWGGETATLTVEPLDGSSSRQIEDMTAKFSTGSAWSPDRDSYARLRRDPPQGLPSPTSIYALDIASLSDGDIATVRGLVGAAGLVWSADGKRLAFGRDDGTTRTIEIVEADGTGRRVVIEDRAGGADPGADGPIVSEGVTPDGPPLAFSPDGTRLVYLTPGGFAVIPIAGGAPMRLPSEGRDYWAPAWSPDGSKIAFVVDEKIMVVTADGSPVVHPVSAVSAFRWAPDGSRLAFVSGSPDVLGGSRVEIVDLAGRAVPEMPSITGLPGSVAWSPDGTALAVMAVDDTSDMSGRWDWTLYRFDAVSPAEPVRLSALGGDGVTMADCLDWPAVDS